MINTIHTQYVDVFQIFKVQFPNSRQSQYLENERRLKSISGKRTTFKVNSFRFVKMTFRSTPTGKKYTNLYR